MAVATQKRKLLWIGQRFMPRNVALALDGQWEIVPCASAEGMTRQLDEAEVVLIAPPHDTGLDPRWLAGLLDAIDRSGSVAVVLMPPGLPENHVLWQRRGQCVMTSSTLTPMELSARLDAVAALGPTIRRLQADLAAVRNFGPGASKTHEHLDEEMRLAARLQRDFLPRTLPNVGGVKFASLFRPASWVSGDIYDVFRLDEVTVGFYIADVVGHGMPAALLTMFIKKSLQTKRISAHAYQIVPPHEALAQLNADICQQDLSSCQFCTAIYGVLDTRTLTLRYARGGHPMPVLFRPGSGFVRLEGHGPLLGIFPDESYEQREVQLQVGDRLVVFSDGAEETLTHPSAPTGSGLMERLESLRAAPAETAVLELTSQIDSSRAHCKRDDDVTVLLADVMAEQACQTAISAKLPTESA